MSEEDKGFTVKDRRRFGEDGSPRPEDQPAQAEAQEGEPQAEKGPRPPLPPVDFSAFILSLSHAAMMHLGHLPDPLTGETSADLEMARHTIDTIGMLKEKTAGNLTQDEHRLIESVLTELRLAFVRLSA